MSQCGKKPAGRITEIKDIKAVVPYKYRIDPYNTEATGTEERNDHWNS